MVWHVVQRLVFNFTSLTIKSCAFYGSPKAPEKSQVCIRAGSVPTLCSKDLTRAFQGLSSTLAICLVFCQGPCRLESFLFSW